MRRTKEVTIDNPDSRDNGKTYLLKEMSPPKAEKWAMKALLLIARSGINIDPVRPNMGLMGLAAVSSLPLITFPELEPLMDEMMECVSIVPKGKDARKLMFSGGDSDIEDVATFTRLRKDLLELHLGFTFSEFQSKQNSEAGQAIS